MDVKGFCQSIIFPKPLGYRIAIGFFKPNWNFLYEHELVKSNKFYTTGSGGLKIISGHKIGASISWSCRLDSVEVIDF